MERFRHRMLVVHQESIHFFLVAPASSFAMAIQAVLYGIMNTPDPTCRVCTKVADKYLFEASCGSRIYL